jgi:exopolysaccharide biosynthesis polyprenyl glycosylphosphotransferase
VWWWLSALYLDAIAVALTLGGAALLRLGPLQGWEMITAGLSPGVALNNLAVALPIWIASLAAFGLYSPTISRNPVEQTKRIVSAGLAAPIAFISLAFVFHQDPSRLWVALATVLTIPSVTLGRRGLQAVVSSQRNRGKWQTKVVLVGRHEAKALVEELTINTSLGLQPVATCGFAWEDLPHGELHDLASIVRTHGVRGVLIVAMDMERDEINRAVAVADELPAEVVLLPGLDYTLAHNLSVLPLGNQPGLALQPASLRNYQRLLKRGLDLVFASAALVVLSPVLFAVGILIRLNSRGRAIFKQPRVGEQGEIFTVWKFRTMVDGAAESDELYVAQDNGFGFTLKMPGDPRVTGVGKFLRRTSLDELPQLINVIKGDMSIVGPRPVTLRERDQTESVLAGRLLVTPGITGLWQVSGRSALSAEDRARLDLTYVRNWSLLLDLYIMLRTIPAVVRKHGAY